MDKILEWMSPTRWAILLALLLALVTAFIGYGQWCANAREESVVNRYEAAIAKMQAEAARKLGAAIKRNLELERNVAAMQAEKDAENERRRIESRAASQRLADAAAAHGGRLRDPNAESRSCGGSTAPEAAPGPGAGASAGGEEGGVFSAGATRLLQRLTREADEVNDAYATCRGTLILWKQQYDPPDGPPSD